LTCFGPAVDADSLALLVELEAEFRRDDHLTAKRCQRLTHEQLVRERAVRFCGIEEGDPAIDGGAEDANRLVPVCSRAQPKTEAHGPHADR
jgi:hypothetical protein